MLSFAKLDEPKQQKICEQSRMLETKHDLVAIAEKLWFNLDCEPKPCLPIDSCLTPSTSGQLEQSDTTVASSSYKDGRKKEVFCSYFERKGYKKVEGQKKSRNAKQHKKIRPNTAGAKVATVNESGSGHRQVKEKNLARRQWLVVVLVWQEVQALVDTANNLNLIQKDIADHLRLRPVSHARAATQAGGILKSYSVFHERLQITDSFGRHFDARDLLTSVNIKVTFILGLPWLQHHNFILNFDPMTIQSWDFSSIVTDSIEKWLDLESLI